MTYEELYKDLSEKVLKYLQEIQGVGFAWPENNRIKKDLKTPQDLAEALEMILRSSMELNRVLEDSPASIYIADAAGTTIRVNKAFEEMAKIDRTSLFGRNVDEIERDGIFKPSVCSITRKEKRKVAVLQQINDVSGIYVTGVPVFDENGKLFRTITNALLLEDINTLTSYVKKSVATDTQNESAIIAESAVMQEIIKLVDMVKNTDTSVLITGETGVGKGVLARYVHNTSNRQEKRMMEINCGAIPDALLESELFGYESGAFTGADRKGKPGLIEMSEGGTLFLDEISELPLLLQVKLLHFLQNRTITRVGGTNEIHINARVIAASNRDLKKAVERGTFRSDLYYRLNVIPITIPPLRERRDDIRSLATYFYQKYKNKYGKSLEISEEYLAQLYDRNWPGNVRELENYIERTVVTNGIVAMESEQVGQVIQEEAPLCSGQEKSGRAADQATRSAAEQETGAAAEQATGSVAEQKTRTMIGQWAEPMQEGEKIPTLKELEKELVITAYDKYRSSYKVAEVLGISQTAAYRKIKKYINEK